MSLDSRPTLPIRLSMSATVVSSATNADTAIYLSYVCVSESLSNAVTVDVNKGQGSEDRDKRETQWTDVTDAGCPENLHTMSL